MDDHLQVGGGHFARVAFGCGAMFGQMRTPKFLVGFVDIQKLEICDNSGLEISDDLAYDSGHMSGCSLAEFCGI